MSFTTFRIHVYRVSASYINVCGRHNPDLSQCIRDNVENLRDKICNGLVEMNLPALEPITIKKLVISDTDNSQIYLNDITITGLCDFVVNRISVDLDKFIFDVDVTFNQLYLNGTYDIDLRILVPIAYTSPIYLVAPNVKVNAMLKTTTAPRKGKDYMYVSEIKTHIDVKGYEAKYDLKEEERSQLQEIIGGLIGNNQQEFIDRLVPPLEKAISEWLISIANSVFKKFSYDDLFPDRE